MVSVVLLTYNRLEYVKNSVKHNLANAGYPIDEVIWVDNGSDQDLLDYMRTVGATRQILHANNLGVAKGYNAGYKVARGTFIVKPGTDMIMPDNWLKDMIEGMNKKPNAGIISIYHQDISKLAERKPGEEEDGLIPAMALGSQMIRRGVFESVGYLPEEYGLYGWDDVKWDKKVRDAGWETYYLANVKSKHQEHLDATVYRDYNAFKKQEVDKG